MQFSHYLKRVESSRIFKKFIKENKKAYLCAGFFVLDFETSKNLHQLDYYLFNGKIATFIVDKGIKFKISQQALKKKMPAIKGKICTDLEALKGIVHDEMRNRSITGNIKKIIAILHISDGKPAWNLQCIVDGLVLLNVHVDDFNQSVLRLDKMSLLDLIKKP